MLDPEKDKSMVQDLLDFKEQLDCIIDDAFMKSEKFVNSMRVCFITCKINIADTRSCLFVMCQKIKQVIDVVFDALVLLLIINYCTIVMSESVSASLLSPLT